MNAISSKDGTQIDCKERRRELVVIFSHGWPPNSNPWDFQMHFRARQGLRPVVHERRGTAS